ncbi:hypothetical protein [Vibrio maerlii]|uniref:hypothetical protein n=1 Tax=Vibrio maerlii TaxID=2231648 RepID=UPI000E3E524C|nr:hypothetical protein [Vibrio maerlii]
MLTFEQWAIIADIYTPLLILASASIVWRERQGSGCWLLPSAKHLIPIVLTLVASFASSLVDLLLGIWPSFDSDYSTHTAVALVFVVHICLYRPGWRFAAILSLAAYLQLMNHQDYHTYLDMITTIAFLLPLFWLIWKSKTSL